MTLFIRKEGRREDEYVGRVTDIRQNDNVAEELREFLKEYLPYYNGKPAKVVIEYYEGLKPRIKSTETQLDLFINGRAENVAKKKKI